MEGFNRSLALLIAVDRYGDGIPALRTPVADAEALAEVLRDKHEFKCTVLKDEQATAGELRSFLKKLPSLVGSDDRVIFYFAGHGIAVESDDGPKGFILPQDAKRDSESNYLPMAELDEALSGLSCRHVLLILDCCFAGAFRWSSFRYLALSPENLHQERYNWFIEDPAWQAIASAAHDQKALDVAAENPLGKRDDSHQDHSPFARALIEGLKGQADRAPIGGKGDGVITATELYQHVDDELRLSSSNRRLRQTPILWPMKKHDKGQFVFLVPGKALDLPPAPPLNPNTNPWRGLSAYEEKHKDLFYGRGAAADRLTARLLGKMASEGQPAVPAERFIVVTGPSGGGKSSLVKAGILPRLPKEQIHPIIVRPSSPGPMPFASLAAALKEASAGGPSPDAKTLQTDPESLALWVKAQKPDCEVLLVIDQAEELITMSSKEDVSTAFIQLIANALDHTEQGLRVVFTVRSEFEPQFSQSPLKSRWSAARYLVPQMTQDELRRVIEGPAAVKVMRFESAELVDRLVNDVVNMPGALPLLSFALSQMYRHYLERHGTDRAITQADYDALEGGVTGSLRIRANQVVDEGDELNKQTARRVLERFVSIEAGEFARRRVPRWEFEVDDPVEQNRVDHILTRLDEERLIVSDGPNTQGPASGNGGLTANPNSVDGQSHTYLELAHDALILGWDKLINWIREDAALIGELRGLTAAAANWYQSTQRAKSPLWDDPVQTAAIEKLQVATFPGLNRAERFFAGASLSRATRNRTIRWMAVTALLLFAIGAAVAAGIAIVWQKEAVAQLINSESRRLYVESELLGNNGPQFAVQSALRGVASNVVKSSPEATSSLSNSLLLIPDSKNVFEVTPNDPNDKSQGKILSFSSFSPDTPRVAFVRDKDTNATVLDFEQQNVTTTSFDAGARIISAKFSGHGDLIAVSTNKRQLMVFDLTSSSPKMIFQSPITTSGSDNYSISKDGKWVALHRSETIVSLVNLETGTAQEINTDAEAIEVELAGETATMPLLAIRVGKENGQWKMYRGTEAISVDKTTADDTEKDVIHVNENYITFVSRLQVIIKELASDQNIITREFGAERDIIRGAAVSPLEKEVSILEGVATLITHDLEDPEKRRSLTIPNKLGEIAKRIEYSPNGSVLALSFKNSIAIIDTGQSAVIGIINTPDPILMSEFAPDSASLVTVSVRGHFQKWNLLSLPRFNLSKLKIDAAMSPDSKLVAYINPTMIDVIDLSDNKIILREGLLESRLAKVGDTLDFNPDSNLYRIAFSKTADTLLYSFGDGSVADFDIASKKHKLLIPASEGAIEARVDASGSGYVLTTGSELFLNHADKPINLTDIGPKEISVSAGGDYVIASHEAVDSEETFEIRLWDTKTQRIIWTALSHGFDERCPGPRFSPTAKYIICYNDSDQGYPGVSPEEEVSHIREATAGAIVNPAPSDFAGRITTAKFSDDERLVVVWSLEEQTLLWGPPDFVLKGKQASKYQIKSLPGAYGGFLRISPNNQILAMSRGAGGKQEILLLSLNTTAEPIVLRHSLVIEDAAFSQDSKYVATLEQNGDAYVWDSGTGQQVSWLTLGRDANRIAFNLGGDKLIIQGEDLDGVFVESLEWQAATLQSAVCARIRNVYSLADIRAMTAGDGVGACIP